jgi:hypothetical protein
LASPLDIATAGYLNSPLAVAAEGYIYIATVKTVGSGDTRQIQGKSVEHIRQQMRDDEEIVTIILAAIQHGII